MLPRKAPRHGSVELRGILQALCSNKKTQCAVATQSSDLASRPTTNRIGIPDGKDLHRPDRGESNEQSSEHLTDDYGFVAWQQGHMTRPAVAMEQLPRQPEPVYVRMAEQRNIYVKNDGIQEVEMPWYEEDQHERDTCQPAVRNKHSLCRSECFTLPGDQHIQKGSLRTSGRTIQDPVVSCCSTECHVISTNTASGIKRASGQSNRRSMRMRCDDVMYYPKNTTMMVVDSYDAGRDTSGQMNRISVERGQIVNVVCKCGNWLMVRTFGGRQGYIPELCVTAIQITLPTRVRDFTQQYPESAPESAWNHSAVSEQDLGFESFGSISPGANSDIGDYSGVKGSRDSSNYWSELSNNISADTDCGRHAGHPITVLFDYTAKHSDDVTVRHGDVVWLLEDKNDSWCLVRTANGTTGYIPKSYTIDLTVFNLEPDAQTTYL